MAQPFIPLVPAASSAANSAASRSDGRLKVIASESAAFQPLEAKRASARAPSPSPAPARPASAPNGHPPGIPTLEVIRDGDRVSRIQVRCACGELIELDCDY